VKKGLNLKYQLNNIRSEGITLEGVLDAGWFKDRQSVNEKSDVKDISSTAYKIFLIRSGSTVAVKGSVTATLSLACSRCLESFDFPLRSEFTFTLVPEDVSETRPPEKELAAEDLETEFYEGETIDIDKIVLNNLLLSLPLKPLCREECEGLCPVCGANKNLEPCACSHDEPGDPRLAGLKDFFKRNKG
jgi:uncharacterized protein